MSVPHGHRHTATFMGAFRLSGMTAPLVLDGPMTGKWFAASATHVLAPTLGRDDIVILDNLPAHKSATARAAIETRNAQLRFLPPYSADFNPIEMAFSNLKALLPKAAARTPDELCQTIGKTIDRFTTREIGNYFAAAAYNAYPTQSALATAPSTQEWAGARSLRRGADRAANTVPAQPRRTKQPGSDTAACQRGMSRGAER